MFEVEFTGAKGDDIALSKVPAAVKKAADGSVPGAKWESAFSQVVYELEGVNAKGRAVVVEVTMKAKSTT